MSHCGQLKVIICVKIFFQLLNAIMTQEIILDNFNLEGNSSHGTFYKAADDSDVEIVLSRDDLSNIHANMTAKEIYHTFDTTDGSAVPAYKVYPMNLRTSRRKRQTEDKIHLAVIIDGQIVHLNFKATDGHLATKDTPVWLAQTDRKAYRNIRYDPHIDAMDEIEDFRMYHDLENKAAIVTYTDREHYVIMDDEATPYIAQDTSSNVTGGGRRIPAEMGSYFYDEKDRFPTNHYDIVLAMTTMKLCNTVIEGCSVSLGYAYLGSACEWQHEVDLFESINSVGIINYNRVFGGVDTAVHESAHLFGVIHDENVGLSSKCDAAIMARTAELSLNNFEWSPCSKKYFRRYFSLRKSQCLDNKPVPMNLSGRLLSGMWLSLDGQCRNNGYYKACELPGVPPCTSMQACKAEGSDECVQMDDFALRGSKCGYNMHCDEFHYRCINN